MISANPFLFLVLLKRIFLNRDALLPSGSLTIQKHHVPSMAVLKMHPLSPTSPLLNGKGSWQLPPLLCVTLKLRFRGDLMIAQISLHLPELLSLHQSKARDSVSDLSSHHLLLPSTSSLSVSRTTLDKQGMKSTHESKVQNQCMKDEGGISFSSGKRRYCKYRRMLRNRLIQLRSLEARVVYDSTKVFLI